MIGGKLILITNRKSYMRFRLVPKSVTLNYLERRDGAYFALLCVISPNSVASGAHCVKVVENVVIKKFKFAISSLDEFRANSISCQLASRSATSSRTSSRAG